jgi:hypothetical protein
MFFGVGPSADDPSARVGLSSRPADVRYTLTPVTVVAKNHSVMTWEESAAVLDESSAGVRAVSDEEVEHYRKNGWAKLERLYEPWAVEGLLARAKARMGADPLTVSLDRPTERVPNEFNWYARWDGCSHHDDWIRKLSHSRALAAVASRLMGDRVRFYFDHVFVKLPLSSHGGETPWHQDLPHHPLDRQGALTIWVALIDCAPEMGTLSFLSGSHRAGLLGRYLNRVDGVCLTDEHPWVLDEYEISSPLHLHPGDATVHNLAIVHYAQENTTTLRRWVYTTQWLPVSTRYTGAPHYRTDGLGLEVGKPFEHLRFPVIPT